ncbi:MAG: hypothetical protein RSD67_04920 [Oscillospiraceae bacterium]
MNSKNNNMNSKNNNKSIAIIAILSSFIVIAIIFSALNIVSTIESLKLIEENKVVLSQLESEVISLKNIAKDEDKMSGIIKEYEQILPEDIEQYDIYNTVSDLAHKFNVVLSQVSYENVINETTTEEQVTGIIPQKISVQLTLQGSYESIMSMLETLSLDYNITVISSVNLNSNGKSVTVAANLLIYYK